MLYNLATLCALLASAALSAKLPSSFTKCDRKQADFSQCLTKSVENTIHQLEKPIRDVGLPSMEPLDIPVLTIGAGSGPVAFQQNYKNLKLLGFTKIKCAKGEMNFAENKLSLECTVPKFLMDFNYEINGKILMLPIYGNGHGLITIDQFKFAPVFDLEEYEKKGDKYFRVKGYTLELTPEKMNFQLENLFGGDKALGDNVLQVMNENWRELYLDVKASYEEAYGKIFASIFDNLLGKISIKDLFGEG